MRGLDSVSDSISEFKLPSRLWLSYTVDHLSRLLKFPGGCEGGLYTQMNVHFGHLCLLHIKLIQSMTF